MKTVPQHQSPLSTMDAAVRWWEKEGIYSPIIVMGWGPRRRGSGSQSYNRLPGSFFRCAQALAYLLLETLPQHQSPRSYARRSGVDAMKGEGEFVLGVAVMIAVVGVDL